MNHWDELERRRAARGTGERLARRYLPISLAVAGAVLLWWGVNWQAAAASLLLATAVVGRVRY
jgi:hypothetical protein